MNQHTARLVAWGLAIAGTAIVIVLGLYFLAFAPGSFFTLSRDSEDWARFGEYAGGTLGSIFGLLAFGGALVTISEGRQQADRDELQRQMSIFSDRVERILSEAPEEADEPTRMVIQQFARTLSVFSLLATFGNQVLRGPDTDPVVQSKREQQRQLVLPTIRRQLTIVQLELQHLIWCLDKYASFGGSAIILELYKRRYEPVVCWLHVTGLLTSPPLEIYFKPEEFRTQWLAADEPARSN